MMPAVGFGTWKVEKQSAAQLVEDAIRMGYRHIDCACDYGNEVEVGRGLSQSLRAGLCTRQELWITSKLWNTYHRPEHVRAACERTLQDLGLEYLDLYLIHFPISLKFVPFEVRYPPEWIHDPLSEKPQMELEDVDIVQTWRAMESLVEAGLVRCIGVANFSMQLLQHLCSVSRIRPQVNQIELHPFLAQEQLVRFCQSMGLAVIAFSPLGAGSYVSIDMASADESILQHPLVLELAEKYGKTAAQIILRWGLDRGYAVIPKSSRPERQAENLRISDFALAPEEVTAVAALNRNRRFNDPGVFCQDWGAFCPIFSLDRKSVV